MSINNQFNKLIIRILIVKKMSVVYVRQLMLLFVIIAASNLLALSQFRFDHLVRLMLLTAMTIIVGQDAQI